MLSRLPGGAVNSGAINDTEPDELGKSARSNIPNLEPNAHSFTKNASRSNIRWNPPASGTTCRTRGSGYTASPLDSAPAGDHSRLPFIRGLNSLMAPSNSAQAPGTSAVIPTSYADVWNHCRVIAGLLKTTSKTGARDLCDELDRLGAAAADTQDRSLPKPDAILEQLRAVEAAVRYWTDKGFDARLQRTRDRLSGNETPSALSQCCIQIRNILSSNADVNTSSGGEGLSSQVQVPTALHGTTPAPQSPPEPRSSTPHSDPSLAQLPATPSPPFELHVADPPVTTPETKTKNAILGGFKAILKGASGVADVIPDPAGKIVKMIADTGVKVMDVLDDVSDNKDSAMKLGAHIRGLVQAIIQYLPHKKGMSKEGIDDVGLVKVLKGFLSTLETVLTGLEGLRSQGRFKQVALHEQNKSELEEFRKDIERAFQTLQVRLELRTLHLLYGIEAENIEDRRQRLLDRLGGSNNGVQEKGSSSAELVCLPGTRTSVLTFIEGWMNDPSSEPVLWLNAVAGCGKSTIASTVAHRQNELGGTTAIFYFTAGDQAHCGTVIRSLAFGLARSSHGSLEKPILEAIKKEPNVANLTLADQARLLLSEPLRILVPEAPPAVLVIDGLDEWYDVPKVSALISQLVNLAASANVKILVASRDVQHIRMAFTSSPYRIRFFALDDDVDVAAVNGDIRAYLEYHVKELHRVFGLDRQWPGDARMDSLVRKSEGLFQFAATILRFLRSGYPPAILNSILDSEDSSSRLDDLYLTVFGGSLGRSLDRSAYPLLKHVLQCLVCAPVPISLEIIAYLWSDSGPYIVEYNTIQHSILNHLGSFVVVPSSPASPIRFLHTSIVDFLTDHTRCTDERFFVDTTKGHAYLAALCLKRLNRDLKQNICGLEDYMCSMDDSEDDDDEDEDDPEDDEESSDEGTSTGDESELDDGADADTGFNECDDKDLRLRIQNTAEESTSQKMEEESTGEESGSGEGSSSSGAHLEKHAASHTVTSEKVTSAICPGLRYAALYWSTHLDAVPTSTPPANLLSLIGDFASAHILHWIEVLALLRSLLSVGHPASRKAVDWCSRVSSDDLSAPISLFHDTTRFIGLFANALSSQPLTMYEYILSIVPTESALRKTYGTRHDLRVKVIRGPMRKQWPAHQWAVNHGHVVRCIALSPDGWTIASGGDDKRIRLWNAASGMPKGELLEGHTDLVCSLIFNRDGKLLVSSSDDKTIRIWDVETGRARGDPFTGHTDQVRSVALSPDGTIVASGSDDGTIRFWSLESGREMGEPLRMGGAVYSVVFTPDGLTIVCGCGDGSVRRWDIKTRKAVGKAMTGHMERVWSVCVSPNGKIIVSGSVDEIIRMWDTKTGEQIGAPLEGHTHAVWSVAFSPDGETIVSGSSDETIRLWDAKTGKQRGKALTGHTGWVHAVGFTPDGKMVISGSDDVTVRAWDVDGVEYEGEEVEGHPYRVWSAAFTLDARFVATGSFDESIMVWSVETGTLLGKVNRGYGMGKLHFSAGGRALREDGEADWDAHEWDKVVREWDVSGAVEGTGAEICQVEPDMTLEFPDLGVEELTIDEEGWIFRGGRKWLWLPQAYGQLYARCHLLGTKLVLETRPVPILDVANLL